MKELILIGFAVLLISLGFFLIKKLDKFLNEDRNFIKDKESAQPPSCIMLTDELTDEQIMDEIRSFKESHTNVQIVVYDKNKE